MIAETEETIVGTKPNWQPEYIVDIGCGCGLVITTDDGCYMVLYPT